MRFWCAFCRQVEQVGRLNGRLCCLKCLAYLKPFNIVQLDKGEG